MATHCSDTVTCPGGNCVGCSNGAIWCQDPRCIPNCPSSSCVYPDDHDFNGNMVVILILICLMTILFIIWFMYGPQLFTHNNDHYRANVIVPNEYLTMDYY